MAVAIDNRMIDGSRPPPAPPLVFPSLWFLLFLDLLNYYNYNLKLHAPIKYVISPLNLLLLSPF